MRPGDDSQDGAVELRVTDRRRFAPSGERRDETEEASTPEPEAPRAPEPAKPAPPAGEEGQPPRGDATPYEVGIQAVFLIFYQTAMIALGHGPPEMARRVDLGEASQAIHFLKMLEQKTRGNLDADEATALREYLDDAQLEFVRVARQVQQGGGRA